MINILLYNHPIIQSSHYTRTDVHAPYLIIQEQMCYGKVGIQTDCQKFIGKLQEC